MVLRTAIIGMGKMGRIRKKELDRHPGFEVTVLCDINEDIRSQFSDISFFCQWQKALQQPLEAVVVCTSNYISPDIVCAALERGLHVFCEKPPGRNVEDVKRIIGAENAAVGKVLKFGFNHRFHYAVMEAKSIVDSKRYGDMMWARGIYGKAGGLTFENNWRTDPELAGGGILLDQGIHMLDLLCFFLGDFVEVKSFVENCYWKSADLEDNVFALMKTAEGKVAMIHSSATHWKHKFALDLFMEDGYVTINGILSSTRSYGEESITFAKKQFEDEASAFGRPREETMYFDVDDSWRFEIEDFYDCIVGNKRRPIGDSQDAIKVMKLIDRIYQEGGLQSLK